MDLRLTRSLILVTEVGLSWHTLCLYTEFGEGAALTRLFKDALRNKQSGTTTHKYAWVHRHSAIRVCVLTLLEYFTYLFWKESVCISFQQNNGKHNQQQSADWIR